MKKSDQRRAELVSEGESVVSQNNEAVFRKKPYEKPAFRHEGVFETMALSCGKISGTQSQCRFNRKSS